MQEAMRNLLDSGVMSAEQVNRLQNAMIAAFPEALVSGPDVRRERASTTLFCVLAETGMLISEATSLRAGTGGDRNRVRLGVLRRGRQRKRNQPGISHHASPLGRADRASSGCD